ARPLRRAFSSPCRHPERAPRHPSADAIVGPMHQRFAYQLVDVFTREPVTGNPLAVFADPQGLDERPMQRFAVELGFSEPPVALPATRRGCDVRVRIFPPRREIPLAGHPGIGTAFVLAQEGRANERICFELAAGPTPVESL